MGVSKLIINGVTRFDITSDTVASGNLLSGYTATGADGESVSGAIVSKSGTDITASGATVTVPSGYYASQETKSVSSASHPNPVVSIDSATGLVTATHTQTEGYVSADTSTDTLQLTAQGAQTITPGTTDQTVASGKYLTGDQTIKGDSNLVSANILNGITIFGVTGSASGGGTYQTKTVTPSGSTQVITPDSGYDALSSVTVNPVPVEVISHRLVLPSGVISV